MGLKAKGANAALGIALAMFLGGCGSGVESQSPKFTSLWRAPIIQGSSAISWSADSKRLVVVDDNSRGNTVFDAVTSRQISHWTKTHGFENVDIAMMPDGKTVVASPYPESDGHFPCVVSVMNADTGEPIRRVTADSEFWGRSSQAKPFALSDDGRFGGASNVRSRPDRDISNLRLVGCEDVRMGWCDI